MASVDRDALEALFLWTGGDNWKERKDNWATDAELSTWDGVAVHEDGRVKRLALPYNNLLGTVETLFVSLACARFSARVG